MLFNTPFLPLLTRLSLIPFSFVFGFGLLNSQPSTATLQKNTDLPTHSSQLLAQASSEIASHNGVYLYGRSPQPEELGQEYLVFKIEQGRVKGAVYQPRSEFNCFSGSLRAGQMELAITDPYDGNQYPYAIALQSSPPVASNTQVSELGLEGYHRLEKMSDNDHRILQTCLEES